MKQKRRAGILARLPAESLLTVSDFSTVVTAGDREARARMFGALRVVYDGYLYRGIGGEPSGEGRELEWSGHLTLIVGATPIVDTHTSFEGALGERFVALRLAESTAARATARARFAVGRRDLGERRKIAQDLASRLVRSARSRIPDTLPETLVDRLVNLAAFVAHARTGVQFEGSGKYRVILGVPTPEEPTRLVGQLNRLARCAVALGLDPVAALELTTKVALDSVPLARMRALRAVAETGETGATVSDVRRALIRGNRWAAIWELDALEAIGLVAVTGPSRDEDPGAIRTYRLAEEYVDAWKGVYETVPLPHPSPLLREEEEVAREGTAYEVVHPETEDDPPSQSTPNTLKEPDSATEVSADPAVSEDAARSAGLARRERAERDSGGLTLDDVMLHPERHGGFLVLDGVQIGELVEDEPSGVEQREGYDWGAA